MPSAERPDQPLLSLENLVWLHTVSIEEFGGAPGIRDRGLLESALHRPLTGFGGKLKYATAFERAAVLAEAVIQNHAFIDGNKRTGIYAMAAWMEREGFQIAAKRGELRDLGLAIADHRIDLLGIVSWLRDHSTPVDPEP